MWKNSEDPTQDDALVGRYVAGECSLAEQARMERWLAAHPAVGEAIRIMRADGIHAVVRDTMPGVVTDAEQRLLARIGRLETSSHTGDGYAAPASRPRGKSMPPSRQSTPLSAWWGRGIVAAALVVAVVLIRMPRHAWVSTASGYATAAGQRATFTLADGTQVTLAPETRLDIGPDFGQSTRTVTLVGQAYFHVADSNGAPFVVRTQGVVTRVLGTAFDVKHYATDRTTRIVVAQGKVQSVRSTPGAQKPPVVMVAGMMATFTDSIVTLVSDADVSAYTGWRDGHLDFKREPIRNALAVLERWYGIRFQVADSAVLAGTVTGSLDFQNTSTALNTLKPLLGVDMTFDRRGDTTVVILRAQRDGRARTRPQLQQTLTPSMEVGR